MSETTINQRLKFLLELLDLKAGQFARALGLSETTVRNYVDRTAKPSSDVIEKIATTFRLVNLAWLITGEGPPLHEADSTFGGPRPISLKNNSGNAIGINHGKASQQQGSLPGNEATLLKEIENLKQQLKLKDELLAAKQESIDLLKVAFKRPN